MKIAAYVDESGRHDPTGKQRGSGQIIVAGWVDSVDNWDKFCTQWQAVLKKYTALHFHFTDWAGASAVARKARQPNSSDLKNPYSGWGEQKLNAFLYELAEIAGGGQKLFVGNFVSTRDFYEAKNHPAYAHTAPAKGPYQACINGFFESFSMQVQQQWPEWKDPVAFFFDQNGDTEWCNAIRDAFEASRKKDSRIAALSFVDSKISPNFPVQAADMFCYRSRQIADGFLNPDVLPVPSRLDDLLFKPMYERATSAFMNGVFKESPSTLQLRHGIFPWRKQS